MPTSSPTRAPLRRLPVPVCDPPYDDEVPAARATRPAGAVQGTLALAFVLPTGLPAVPAPPPGLRLVAAPEPAEALSLQDETEFGPQPTSRSALPDPRPWAGRFLQALLEVLAGDRPLGQLVRWTSHDVFGQVAAMTADVSRPRPGATAREVVRSVHVDEPDDGVAEVAALVRSGVRARAVALRMEGLDGRWQCTAVELG